MPPETEVVAPDGEVTPPIITAGGVTVELPVSTTCCSLAALAASEAGAPDVEEGNGDLEAEAVVVVGMKNLLVGEIWGSGLVPADARPSRVGPGLTRPPRVAVLSSTESDCEVVQARLTSDFALTSSSGSLLASKLWRLPLRIFCKIDRKIVISALITLGFLHVYSRLVVWRVRNTTNTSRREIRLFLPE